MILIILIREEGSSENDHFLNTQILKKYSSFYVLLFDSGPLIIDPKQTSFVKSLFSVLSTNLTYVDEER